MDKFIPESNHLVAYLLVEIGSNGSKRTLWKPHGRAYPCRDGSLNLKLDIHPNLTFNLRLPKSNGEREEINDRTFDCGDCNQTFPDEQAHLLIGNGVVCDACSPNYKLCESCDMLFSKTIRTKLCPNCK